MKQKATKEQLEFENAYMRGRVDEVFRLLKIAGGVATVRHKEISGCGRDGEVCHYDLLYMDKIMQHVDDKLRKYFENELRMRPVQKRSGH